MTVTADLAHEHRIIERVLQALARQVAAAEASGRVDAEALRAVVTFSQRFIDRCHHGKEERCLFPCLERVGVPREGEPVAMLLAEHEEGRRYVAQIAAALDAYAAGTAAAEAVLEPCRRYVELLQQHIFKENNMLFPMADGLMAEGDQEAGRRCFEHTEEDLGAGEHERLAALAEEIAAAP